MTPRPHRRPALLIVGLVLLGAAGHSAGAATASTSSSSKPSSSKPSSSKPNASGTVTVNGKVSTMRYAVARHVKGFFDATHDDTEVIVSDVVLTPKALVDPFERDRLAKAGKLHAFELTIDHSRAVVSTSFRDGAFKGPSPSGVSSSDVLAVRTFTATTIDATYRSAEPAEFFGDTYSFDVTFKTPIAAKAK